MISDLTIVQEHKGSIGIIKLVGQVDLSNAHQLREAVDSELSQDYKKIIINTQNLNFIDSSALGVLISGLKKITEAHGFLVIVANSYVQRLLSVTGLAAIFEVKNDLAQAIASLENK